MSRLLLVIFLLFGTGVVGIFYLNPEWQKFQSLRQENISLQYTSEEFDSLTERRDALIREINAISKEQRNLISRALPEGAKAADFMVDLETITKKRGLILKRIDLTGTVEVKSKTGQPQPGSTITNNPTPGTILEFPIILNVTGPYESFKEFLGDLEKNLRLIDMLETSFITPPQGRNFDFNLRLKTYYQ